VVPRAELEAFHDDVDALRDDVERLAARCADRTAPIRSRLVTPVLRAWRIGRVLLRYRLDACSTRPRPSAGCG
jgi:hypothetical protein